MWRRRKHSCIFRGFCFDRSVLLLYFPISSFTVAFLLPQQKLIVSWSNWTVHLRAMCFIKQSIWVIMEITDLLSLLDLGTISNRNIFSIHSSSVYHDEVWLAMSWKTGKWSPSLLCFQDNDYKGRLNRCDFTISLLSGLMHEIHFQLISVYLQSSYLLHMEMVFPSVYP